MDRRTALVLLTIGGLSAGLAAVLPSQAAEPEIYVNSATGEAINGYDPVAYFTEMKPVRGDAAFTFAYKGAPFLFASAQNRDLFAADPEKYAPQYGGWCAYAMSQGRLCHDRTGSLDRPQRQALSQFLDRRAPDLAPGFSTPISPPPTGTGPGSSRNNGSWPMRDQCRSGGSGRSLS